MTSPTASSLLTTGTSTQRAIEPAPDSPPVYVGVDWGGSKIEAVTLTEDGTTLARTRQDTPRSDYAGCLRIVADLVTQVEQAAGTTGTVGVGIPGSVDRLARLVWNRYVDRVARGLDLVVNALDPDVFVMGGGMSNVGELYDDLPARWRPRPSRPASTPRSRVPLTATPPAYAAPPGSGKNDLMQTHDLERFAFGQQLITDAGALALDYFDRVSSLTVTSKGPRTWSPRPTSRWSS